jgi:uncharacterized Tic20 family protein
MSDQYPSPHAQQPEPAYRGAPATMSAQEERTWGAISHAGAVVAMICSAGFLGFLASIAVYVVHKDRGPFVRSHAANSINVQISMFIWLVVATVLYVVLGIVTLGIGFVVFLPVFAVPFVVAGVLHVIGAVKAWNGEWWNPPLTPQFVR